MAALKPATTVISIVPTTGKRYDYDVLLIRRSDKARFMPGAHVFPGGVAEKIDADPSWTKMLGSKASKDLPFKLTGIRELFEETSVLLSDPSLPLKVLSDWQGKVAADASQFLTLFRQENSLPDVGNLFPFSRWQTPEKEKFRYDTYFYIAFLDSKPETQRDIRETSQLDWLTPEEAIKKFRREEIWLPPPTYVTLSELSAYQTIAQLKAALATSSRDMTPLLPEWVNTDDGTVIAFPGDALHVSSRNSGHRNRLTMRGKHQYVLERPATVPKANI